MLEDFRILRWGLARAGVVDLDLADAHAAVAFVEDVYRLKRGSTPTLFIITLKYIVESRKSVLGVAIREA